jgi:hypothetical protein
MNDNNYLKDIISTSKIVAINTYNYLEDILVFKDYEIDENADLITQSKQFILRYRRIIGIILLAILLYIWFNCDINKSDNKTKNSGNSGNSANSNENRERIQKGGASAGAGAVVAGAAGAAGAAGPAPAPAPKLTKAQRKEAAFERSEKAAYEQEKKKAALQEKFKKNDADKAAEEEKQKKADEIKKLEDTKAQRKQEKASRSFGQKTKDMFHSKAGTELQREKLKGAYKDSAVGKKMDEIKSMRDAGISKKKIAGQMAYQAGAYVGEKFKEFAGWLYEILFAIAISIAICMVVLPSISFFLVALFCFFLLKKKMSQIKGI